MSLQKYKLTDDELSRLKLACKPVPYMVVGGIEPKSPRELAMIVWQSVAERVNCDVWSIEPDGDDPANFLAKPKSVYLNG